MLLGLVNNRPAPAVYQQTGRASVGAFAVVTELEEEA
jgi:hypothetical protein